jgi:hypothetical protein
MIFAIVAASCGSRQPSIVFTKVPPAGEGSPFEVAPIEGRVVASKPGQHIVLYAKSNVWWIQPSVSKPSTAIGPDSVWHNNTHPGTQYAALLVDPNYNPPLTIRDLPPKGGLVSAVAIVNGVGRPPAAAPSKTIRFSGYDWEVLRQGSNRGGGPVPIDPVNVSLDAGGFLHLRTSRQTGVWAGAEVRLTSSLGLGTYRFTVRDVSHMELRDVLTMFTWDNLAADEHHREVDMQVTRWNEPSSKNAEFVVQPYADPSNVVRYEAPPGPLTYSFHWEPRIITFQTVRGAAPVATHVFTSGVPSPGGEFVNISFYVFGGAWAEPRQATEVIVEKFEFLP